MKICVLGDGGWGTALAQHLSRCGHETVLWGAFPDYVGEMSRTRRNPRFLPGVELNAALGFESEMGAAVAGAELIVLASPSKFMRGTLERLRAHFDRESHCLVNVAKGIETGTLKRMSELCFELLGDCRYCVLSGPSHAEEVVMRAPTAVVAASADEELAERVQAVFMDGAFRVYTTDDVVSVELGGALKNVMAIAAGVIDGMRLGDNAKAAMMTRGIAEMGRLGEALGGRSLTFSGLSGIGDLIVTCASGHSRNRHVGEELGRGKGLRLILEEMGMVVAEGVDTAIGAHALACAKGVEAPIIGQVHSILHEGKAPMEAVRELMERKARGEFD